MRLTNESLNTVHGSAKVIYVHIIEKVIPHIYLRTLILDYIGSESVQVVELRNDAGYITSPAAGGV